MHFQAVGREFARYDVGRALLLESEFGVGMQVAPKGDQLVEKRKSQQRHGYPLRNRVRG